jgi:hypothetical protein
MTILLPDAKSASRLLMMQILDSFNKNVVEMSEGMVAIFSSYWLSNQYICGIKLFTQAQRKIFKTPVRMRKYMHTRNIDVPGAILLITILIDIEVKNMTWRHDDNTKNIMSIFEDSFYIYCQDIVGIASPYFLDSRRINSPSLEAIDIIRTLFVNKHLFLASYSVSLVFESPGHNGISPVDMLNLLGENTLIVVKSRIMLLDSVKYPFDVTDNLTSTAFWIWYGHRKSLHVAIFQSCSPLKFVNVPNHKFSLELASIIEGIPVAAHYISEHINEGKLFTISCLFLYSFDNTDLDIRTIDVDIVRKYFEIDDYAFVDLAYYMLRKYNFESVMKIIRDRIWHANRHGCHCMKVIASTTRDSLGEDNYKTLSQCIDRMHNFSRGEGLIEHLCETELVYRITPQLKFSERVRSLISYIYPYLPM